MNKAKKLTITLLFVLVSVPLVVFPTVSVIVYETVFGMRYETAPWLEYGVEDFPGLQMERSDFSSSGVTLAGYKYSKLDREGRGVVVVAHGMGGGGHNGYMPFIDYFTSMGYYVFSYDAIGNDNSGGNSVEGLPQGVVCLDDAITHAMALEEYKGLPFTLFGHSFGGYSVGSVLSFHPEIKAAVIVSGFNESEDLLRYQGERVAGDRLGILMPYFELYEYIKFGKKYCDASVLSGFEKSNAEIMIVHSKNDAVVPTRYGYDIFYEAYGDSDRFEFILYEERGHDYPFYSDAAMKYCDQLNEEYKKYVEDGGREYCEEVKIEFMEKHLDKKRCFEPDPQLMESIIEMFDRTCSLD